MVFPKFHIDEVKRQTGRDLTRFDLDFDLPDHFSAGVSSGDLPDNAARSGGCVARETGDDRQLF